jgi:hypothetical protein
MSSPVSSGLRAPTQGWIVRRATSEDVAGVVVAVQELLLELGATPPSASALQDVACELVEDRDAGGVFLSGLLIILGSRIS